ncbi:hypothetical protein [Kineosporia succinea]|uniref:HK97 gp10 family phage protein n=1 Tax=Kineosporia succinea TaxID=84632 RepID=A0ABT9P5S9_9ACTN|nr:hypothetical protein [Kineosporia succinea]MDP9828041.1 hypothetical protein [Kineosporia succinea]
MDVELTPSKEFERVIARMKGAPPQIKRTLSKEIKDATAPIERAAKANIKGTQVRGVRGGGAAQRGAANAARSKRGATGKTGLRESIAKGVTRKITYSGFRTGVRVRVDGKYLPESQRALIRATNKGQWRHPVFGNTSAWVTQKITPAGWFDRAVSEHGPAAIKRIREAARKALQELEK